MCCSSLPSTAAYAPEPWDKLRSPMVCPIQSGSFKTTEQYASVHCQFKPRDRVVRLGVASSAVHLDELCADNSQVLSANDLRELSRFCVAMADQLDGKM